MNSYKELVSALREEAEAVKAVEWDIPICTSNHIAEAADAIEKQKAAIERLEAENRAKEQYISETIGKLASERKRDDEIIASLQKELVEAAKERDAAMPVRHGHWIEIWFDEEDRLFGELPSDYKCSICGGIVPRKTFQSGRYCPNCGAKMGGVSE